MRRNVTAAVLALVAMAGGRAMSGQDAQDNPPPDPDKLAAAIRAEWPKRLRLPEKWTKAAESMPAGVSALPDPSLTEPFEIGEALHDPSRVEEAVVSLLALMRVGVMPDGAPIKPAAGAPQLRMTEAEVRSLISMGTIDAEAAAGADGPPFTFADLHRSLSPFLRGMTVDQLAARYAQAYENNPEWLVPRVLLGQPVEPDAPLLRTQLWLLLADAVSPIRAARRRAGNDQPRLLLASASAGFPRLTSGREVPSQGLASWSAGAILPDPRVLDSPDARFTDDEWLEVLTRLPAFLSGVVSLTSPRAHEKHSGGGSNARIEARLSTIPPPMVSSTTSRILLVAKSGSIAGLPLAWNYKHKLLTHGTMDIERWAPVRAAASGVAQLTFTPKNEVANGRGDLMRDSGSVEVYMDPSDLLVALYNVPASARNIAWGQVQVGQTELTVEWHATELLNVAMLNEYRVRILGALQRDGVDFIRGRLELAEDGTYHGEVTMFAVPTRTVLPGKDCRHGEFFAMQRADVVGTPITEQDSPGQREGAFYNAVRSSPKFFEWDLGTPTNYLRLEFYPKEAPGYWREVKDRIVRRGRPACYDEIGGIIDPSSGSMTPKFIPLNAAQLTIEHAGYAIAIPARGETLSYSDLTGAGKFFQSNKTIAGAIQQLAAGTDAKWSISINSPPQK